MKFTITIKVSKTEKVSYGTSEVEKGTFSREFNQNISAEETKAKFVECLSQAKLEVNEIFNQSIEEERVVAAKEKAEANS